MALADDASAALPPTQLPVHKSCSSCTPAALHPVLSAEAWSEASPSTRGKRWRDVLHHGFVEASIYLFTRWKVLRCHNGICLS